MQLASLGLALNPCARISVHADAASTAFLVQAPVRGAQVSTRWVAANEHPAAHGFLVSTLIRGERVEQASAEAIAELRAVGLLAPMDAVPQAVHYDLAAHSHPVATPRLDAAAAADRAGAPVRGRGFRLPEDWAASSLRFQPHHHGSVWAPVLVDAPPMQPADEGPGPAAAELDAPATREQFAREGFVELADLLPASHVAELGRYFQALAAEGFMSLDENRGSRRFISHSHPVADFWHDQLNQRVSQLVGRATKPSYSFVTIYLAGGDLKWHTDRPPCEYTITVLLDYAPLGSDARSSWPLLVKGRDGRVHELHQRIGDALIFKGRELEHCRAILPEGHRSASLLFHFVDAEYDGEMT
jgi:hypothetical protein